MENFDLLRELFNSRFDTLEATIASMSLSFQKTSDRQDEAIERLADRTTHVSETQRLTERVIKLEAYKETAHNQINDLQFKVKVTWAVGGAILTAIMATLVAVIQNWIGL